MKISVIIPVYNVASYIERCLDSVIAQTYADVECIIVDDCGSDNSMDIVRQKLVDYTGPVRFKIVKHASNRGLSAARNTGTKEATGDYIYYLDSDDFILPDTLALLAEPLRSGPLDFVIGNYASGGNQSCFIKLQMPEGICRSSQEILESYLNRQWYMMAWNKLVSRKFLDENGLEFLEGILHEDELWSFQLACLAESMGVVNDLTYVYRIRQNSITQKPCRKNLDSLVRISEEAEAFVAELGLVENMNICRFLTAWRERLAYRAMPFGRKLSFLVYCKHVRKKTVCNSQQDAMTIKQKFKHLHHVLPPLLGYFYYAVIIRGGARLCASCRLLSFHG